MRSFDAVVLLAHGARDPRWLEPFARLRAAFAERLAPDAVGLAFMDLAAPSFADVARDLAARGARRVLVVPVFLSGGGHVARDVPTLVDPERARYPEVSFTIAGALGEEPEVRDGMLAAVARIFAGG